MADYGKINCADCKVFACPEECFNQHPGSKIAMKKLIRAMGKQRDEVHLIGDWK